MDDKVECMCMQCGISNYLLYDTVVFDDIGDGTTKIARDNFCSECGGMLILVGKAGDEPSYRLA